MFLMKILPEHQLWLDGFHPESNPFCVMTDLSNGQILPLPV